MILVGRGYPVHAFPQQRESNDSALNMKKADADNTGLLRTLRHLSEELTQVFV